MNSRALGAVLLLSAFAAGCGYSEDEWQAQLGKYQALQASSAARESDLQRQLDEAKKAVADLEAQLKAAGIDLKELEQEKSRIASTLEERERALAEYKARAQRLEAIRARYELLRKKLDELTKVGLAVHIRKNRMVISLPGDVLFDSGQDTLKKDGKEILDQVAGIIKADASLISRSYQVAGHTDNKPFRGAGSFKDNWGLSLMRARGVLLHLVDVDGMPREKWSAAGFADTDPIAPNDDDAGRQKNRRCDLIVVPSVEEMLDLKSLTN